jgi:hypothetical protein
VLIQPIFPLSGKALLYLKVGRLFPLEFLTQNNVVEVELQGKFRIAWR